MYYSKFFSQFPSKLATKATQPPFTNDLKLIPKLDRNECTAPDFISPKKRMKCTQSTLQNESADAKSTSQHEAVFGQFANKLSLLSVLVLVSLAMPGCAARNSTAAGDLSNAPLLASVQAKNHAQKKPPILEDSDSSLSPTPLPESQTTAHSELPALMKVIDARRLGITSVTAHLRVKLITTESSHDLNCTLYADNEGNLRMQFIGPFRILALDVAIQKETLTCLLPTKKSALRGSRQDVIKNGPTELALVAQVANIQDLFFPRAWASNALERRGVVSEPQKVTVNVLGGKENDLEYIRSFKIQTQTAQVLSQEVFFENKCSGRIEYIPASESKNSENILGDNGYQPEKCSPQLVKLTDTRSGSILSFEIQSIELNIPIAAEQFKLQPPASIRIQTPREFTVDSKSLMSGGCSANYNSNNSKEFASARE